MGNSVTGGLCGFGGYLCVHIALRPPLLQLPQTGWLVGRSLDLPGASRDPKFRVTIRSLLSLSLPLHPKGAYA